MVIGYRLLVIEKPTANSQWPKFNFKVTQKSQKFAEMVFNKNRENPSLRKILF